MRSVLTVESDRSAARILVATRGPQCRGSGRHLDLLEDAVIEARRRYAVGEPEKCEER